MCINVHETGIKTERKAGTVSRIRVPELLAPAGNMDCLKAAIDAGCDAIYAGADRYGARAYAGNFTSEEYVEAVDYAHLFGARLYLTLNTLIKPHEMTDIYDFVRPFYEAGLDGVIVQDIGVASLLLKEFKDMEVHASTQMSVSSVYGVRLLQDMGITRVVPSRELSLKEISEIYENTGIELECFIHGAMCYSYSGMCLMSSMLGGRSGNRGRCAGPCRQPYSASGIQSRSSKACERDTAQLSGRSRQVIMQPEDSTKRHGQRGREGTYLLSMKDLCTIDILDELIMAGIASFKIEGRMKSPEYVYGVTSIYRKYIDKITRDIDAPYKPDEADRRRLTELYSRGGISEGYYHRHNGLSMITVTKGAYKREDKEKYTAERRRIPLDARLEVYAGETVSLTVRAGTTARNIQNNSGYIKGGTAEMMREAAGICVTVTGETAEKADKHPMGSEELKKQIMKTGDSEFCFDQIDINTDGKSFVRVSSLNALRRDAINKIRGRLLNDHKRSL